MALGLADQTRFFAITRKRRFLGVWGTEQKMSGGDLESNERSGSPVARAVAEIRRISHARVSRREILLIRVHWSYG